MVSSESAVDTKAPACDVETINLSTEEADLFVTASVSLNEENPFEAVSTRGAVVTAVDKFDVLMSGAGYSLSGVAKPSEFADRWAVYNGDSKVEWPTHDTDDAYTFLSSYLEAGEASYDLGSGAYKGIKGAADADNAAAMKDLLLANTSGVTHNESTYHSKESYVKVHFYHALAAVRFRVNGDVVKRITINGVAQNGTATPNAVAYAENSSFKSAVTWSDLSDKGSYSQSFSGSTPSEEVSTFFIIPQSLEGVTVSFDLQRASDGTVYRITTKAENLGTTQWGAGYIYTYTVDTSKDGNVGICVSEDKFVPNTYTKSHVASKSTTRSTEYVRAYVVGYWCLTGKKGSVIYSQWSDADVTYEAQGADAPWFKDGDFFYLKSPLAGYTTSEDLIKEYVETNSTRPREDLHLELHVLTQAVEWDADKAAVRAAWGNGVADKLSIR